MSSIVLRSGVLPHIRSVALTSPPCATRATDELWAFAKCGLKAAAEQQCGVPDCNFFFPYPGDQCNEDPGSSTSCKKQCDSSDGADATGLGFLTAAAAVAAAL